MKRGREADVEECWVEEVAGRQRIGAAVFTPFVIARLGEGTGAAEATLAVTLRGLSQGLETQTRLRLRWEPESAATQPLGVQGKVITEWAACGIACMMVALYTGCLVSSVADEGDRFDYWVSDGEQGFGLEVSGTVSEERTDLEARHRAKVRQLRENPYGVDGFVVVAGLTTREVILSRHRFEEATL